MANLALAIVAEAGVGIFEELDRGESGKLCCQSLNLGAGFLGLFALAAIIIFFGPCDERRDTAFAQRLTNVVVEAAELRLRGW